MRSELLRSLKVIKKYCNDTYCEDCPMANDYDESCLLCKVAPLKWNIKGVSERE